MAKMRIQPDPYLAHVTSWPHEVSGRAEVHWCAGDSIEGTDTPSLLTIGLLDENDEVQFSFGIDGVLLDQEGISLDDLDDGIRVLVEVEPAEGECSPIAEDGKLIHYQIYMAFRIARVHDAQA